MQNIHVPFASSHLPAFAVAVLAIALAGCKGNDVPPAVPGASRGDDEPRKFTPQGQWQSIASDSDALGRWRCAKPRRFANVFSFGYAADTMPKDDARFEALLVKLKKAGFNTVHSVHTPRRLALCRKHGFEMMVDMLAPSCHVYNNVAGAQAVCAELRGRGGVWGYNLWNDGLGAQAGPFNRHVRNVRTWDNTHPVFVCTEDAMGIDKMTDADILCYWDYYWERDPGLNFRHLIQFTEWTGKRDQWFYVWVATNPGAPGRENTLRALYTVNTAIACGAKGFIWFLGTSLMDPKTLEWKPTAREIMEVNAQIVPLGQELVALGNPTAVYSTPVARTPDNRPLADGRTRAMPPGLENAGFPAGFRLQPAGGEFVMGVFQHSRGRDAAFIANHNAYIGQDVVLKVAKPNKVSLLDRKSGKWKPLPIQDGAVRLFLSPAGGELLRLE